MRRPGGNQASTSRRRQSVEGDVRRSAAALSDRYGDHDHYNRANPLDELLYIMCSVLTQEANYRRTHRALRAAFPTFGALAAASADEIAAAIASGGLSERKGAAIHAIMRRLEGEFGRPTLAPLRAMSDDDCERFLTSLPLVGRKTARCVMMYSLGRSVFPVDTHCWRVAVRRRWVLPSRADAACTPSDMDSLQAAIPPPLRRSLHVNLISLGRDHCRPVAPRCDACPIRVGCSFAAARGVGSSATGASVGGSRRRPASTAGEGRQR